MNIKRIFTTVILITTLLVSATCQETLTPCQDSGRKDTTFTIISYQAFLISATFKRMNYLQQKSILQDSLSINYEIQKQKYNSLVSLYETQKKLHAIEKQMIVEKYELELDRKRKWRMATVLTGAGLLLFMSIAI